MGADARNLPAMPLKSSLSIIVATCNRAEALRRTLQSLAKVTIRGDWKVELIVVNNASTDHTASVLESVTFPNLKLISVPEPRKGKSNALNTALSLASGDYLLFTDDDVIVPENWVQSMVESLESGNADAIVGRIRLAPELNKPWLSSRQKAWLAAPEDNSSESPELIGANMGFKRAVLQRVPAFDPELGPGALGLGEETLFGFQLVQAGYVIKSATQSVVVHCPDESRLTRVHWLAAAEKNGRSRAYINYHWKQAAFGFVRPVWFSFWLKLKLRRLLQSPWRSETGGCTDWELSYVLQIENCRQHCIEQRRAPNYAKHGLTRLTPG